MKEEALRFEGEISELLPNATFRVKLDTPSVIITAYLGANKLLT